MIDYDKYIKLKKEQNLTWKELAEIYVKDTGDKITWQTFRQRVINDTQPREIPDKAIYEKITHSNDKSVVETVIELTDEEKQDQYAVLEKLGWGKDNWEITKFGLSNWQQHTREQETKNLYAVKIDMKPRTVLTPEQQINAIKEALTEMSFEEYHFLPSPKIDGLDDNMLVSFNITDLHYDAYVDEMSAGAKWNRKISSEYYRGLIDEIIIKQEDKRASKMIFTVGNDFLNTDGSHGQTTRGTQQESDGSFKERYKGALLLHIEAIKTLKKHFNEIELVMLESNHSQDSDFTMYLALEQLFANEPKVKTRSDYQPTQLVEWGKTMIVYNHGDTSLAKKCSKLAQMFSKEYGKAEHRYLILGHIHNGKEHWEDSGFNVHSLPTLYPSNEWAKKNGFISTQQKQVIQYFHKNYGLVANENYTAERLKKNDRLRKRELREQKRLIKEFKK